MASNVKKVAVNATGTTVVKTGEGAYFGFTFRETAGAVATIQIFDNPSAATGGLLDTIRLNASESSREWYGPQGVHYNLGIFVNIVTGTIEGGVRVG